MDIVLPCGMNESTLTDLAVKLDGPRSFYIRFYMGYHLARSYLKLDSEYINQDKNGSMTMLKTRKILWLLVVMLTTAALLSACTGMGSYGGAIAYQCVVDESSHIFVMNPEGEVRTRITDGGGWYFMPSWSPNGDILAYYHFNPGTQMTTVYSVDVTQPEIEQVTLMDRATFDVEFGPLKWSPDEQSLLYYTVDVLDIADIYKIDVATGVVADVFVDSTYYDYVPDWSPDGTQFVFATNRPTADEPLFDLFLADADGENLVQLTDNDDNGWMDTLPAWSPDGNLIAFVRYNYVGGEEFDGGPEGLWVINPATGEETLLYESEVAAEELAPVWSPDGKCLAFLEPVDEEHILRVIDVETGEPIAIGPVAGDKRTVSWSPNSRALIFSNFVDSTATMYILDVKSGELTEVLESEPGASLGDPHWSSN